MIVKKLFQRDNEIKLSLRDNGKKNHPKRMIKKKLFLRDDDKKNHFLKMIKKKLSQKNNDKKIVSKEQ